MILFATDVFEIIAIGIQIKYSELRRIYQGRRERWVLLIEIGPQQIEIILFVPRLMLIVASA